MTIPFTNSLSHPLTNYCPLITNSHPYHLTNSPPLTTSPTLTFALWLGVNNQLSIYLSIQFSSPYQHWMFDLLFCLTMTHRSVTWMSFFFGGGGFYIPPPSPHLTEESYFPLWNWIYIFDSHEQFESLQMQCWMINVGLAVLIGQGKDFQMTSYTKFESGNIVHEKALTLNIHRIHKFIFKNRLNCHFSKTEQKQQQ